MITNKKYGLKEKALKFGEKIFICKKES